MKIIDCFTFFNELDLLEVRLHTLAPFVSKFVLVEGSRTHSNLPKPFYFEENKERFAPFLDKIVHVKIEEDEWCANKLPWALENFQRNQIKNALSKLNLEDDDIILISDCDEIPNPNMFFDNLLKLNRRNTPFERSQYYMILLVPMLYYYSFNIQVEHYDWNDLMKFGTRAIKYKNLKKSTCIEALRKSGDGLVVPNAGWHFSFFGNPESIIKKIQSYAHQEFNKEKYLDSKTIQALMEGGHDLFVRNYSFKKIPLDPSFPQYVLDNQERFKVNIAPL